MTNKEAIKFLKQLYPNGGHCWLDEQRIEAIGMAVKALQEEPVSKEIGDYDHKAVMESLCPQLKEEPTIPDIVDEHFWKMLGEEPVSIWHDASENPKEEEHLMCVYKDNRYHIGKVYKDEFDRLLVSDNKNIIELCMFEKWAYIDDILNLSNVKLPKEIEL